MWAPRSQAFGAPTTGRGRGRNSIIPPGDTNPSGHPARNSGNPPAVQRPTHAHGTRGLPRPDAPRPLFPPRPSAPRLHAPAATDALSNRSRARAMCTVFLPAPAAARPGPVRSRAWLDRRCLAPGTSSPAPPVQPESFGVLSHAAVSLVHHPSVLVVAW